MLMKKIPAILSLLCASVLISYSYGNFEIGGELRKWHRITLTFDGPFTSEQAEVNPFMDYRLRVEFRNGDHTLIVPGYYAADGNAGETGADSGNKWRVRFSPDREGEPHSCCASPSGRCIQAWPLAAFKYRHSSM